jgi:hypothetical protein
VPPARDDDTARRSVVPQAAGRSLWLAAVWTGVGAAIVCATTAIVAVAVCWLPVSGTSGHSLSAVRAGLLTLLAALHGGVTVDGTPSQFVPLGLTVIVGAVAWRAGSGLGDAAEALGERDVPRLCVAGAAQAASFTVACVVATPFAALGSSSAPFLGVAVAALVVFLATGGVAFARASDLGAQLAGSLSSPLASAARIGAAGLAGYLAVGAVLVAGSLAVHASDVQALSREVGGGWGGVPVLLLGVLAAPNALAAGASYLAGPGFAVGAGSTISPFTTAHGTVPAFPLLGALPSGAGATPLVWALVIATPLLAGTLVARLAWRAGSWLQRWRDAGTGAAAAGVLMAVFAWQGGGGIGVGRLHTVGASPGLVGAAVAVELAAVSAALLGAAAALQRLRAGTEQAPSAGAVPRTVRRATGLAVVRPQADDADEADELAG